MKINKSGTILIVLVSIALLADSGLAHSLELTTVTISSAGEISSGGFSNPGFAYAVTAASGYYKDIQAAVETVSAHLLTNQLGAVYVPAGVWNFANPGDWTTSYVTPMVDVPSGISIIGASEPTGTDIYGLGIPQTWSTILQLPMEVTSAGGPWFLFSGVGNQEQPSRFANIELRGYQDLNPSSKQEGPTAIALYQIANYRIDHIKTLGVGSPISAGWYAPYGDNRLYMANLCGLIDHSNFTNAQGVPGPNIADETVGYGIALGRLQTNYWEFDTAQIYGKYTNYTTVIENVFMSKFRHCVTANDGYHYVVRHSIFDRDFGFGTLDNHGTYTYQGTRAVEVYSNVFANCLDGYNRQVMFHRGCGGIYTDNTVDSSYRLFVGISRDAPTNLAGHNFPFLFGHDIYIWNNHLSSGTTEVSAISGDPYYNPKLNVDYFTRQPSQSLDGWTYTPLTYPFPLDAVGFPHQSIYHSSGSWINTETGLTNSGNPYSGVN